MLPAQDVIASQAAERARQEDQGADSRVAPLQHLRNLLPLGSMRLLLACRVASSCVSRHVVGTRLEADNPRLLTWHVRLRGFHEVRGLLHRQDENWVQNKMGRAFPSDSSASTSS